MSHTKKTTIEKIILALLGLLALAALVRTMFLGLEIDEEYALSLGFRLVRGDRLFYSMWEPHQLAALPPALLIGLFTAVAGTTTGVLLFVRGAVLAVKLALAVWFYRSLRVALGGAAPICWRWPCWPSRPSGFWGRTTSASSSTLRWRRSCFCTATTRPARGSTAVCGGSRRAASAPV